MPTPESVRRIDGRAMSPVIRADAKYLGHPPYFCVDVRFASLEQLDTLIAALTKLRKFPEDGFDHIHLQDVALPSVPGLAEVNFWHPSVQRTETDLKGTAEAKRLFNSLAKLKSKLKNPPVIERKRSRKK